MLKKLSYGMLFILLLIACSHVMVNKNGSLVSASGPYNLKVYIIPPVVPADNNMYESIFVQLQDTMGHPVRALEDTIVHLSSSSTQVGLVDSEVTIPASSTFSVTHFYSTYTPGSTTITATANGYDTVQATATTSGPIPSTLALYGFPPILPANDKAYQSITVQLQDASGIPARAPIGDVNVTLSCSNVTVGAVENNVVISAGDTYANAVFHTTGYAGSATITAIAPGFSSALMTMETQQPVAPPTTLKIYIGPPNVPADNSTHQQIAVELQDSNGKIGFAPSNIVVYLSSSSTATGTVQSSIPVHNGEVYETASFTSTYSSGVTTITATATNYLSDQEVLATVGPIPSKIAIYVAPPVLPADNQTYRALLVQLQDNEGTPANDPSGEISVNLYSSSPETGNINSNVSIPAGATYAPAEFFSTYAAGNTTITATASGYETGQATTSTYVIDQYSLATSISAQPDTINSNETTNVAVYVSYNNISPALGVSVSLSSNNGGSFTSAVDERNGTYSSLFTAPSVLEQTVCAITARASKDPYTSGQAIATITVNPLVINVSASAEPNTVNMSEQTTIQVQLTTNGNAPVSGASLNFTSDLGGNFTSAVDEGNGIYEANFTAPSVTEQSACNVLVAASEAGYVNGQSTFGITVLSTITTGNIQLQVLDKDGHPVSEATLASAEQPVGMGNLTGSTDENGNAAFNGVKQGTYTIIITKNGYYTQNQTFTVTPGQTAVVTVNLSSTPSLLSMPLLIAIIAIIIAAALLIFIIVNQKYKISFSKSNDKKADTKEENKSSSNPIT